MSSEDESSDDVPLAELISLRGTSPEVGEKSKILKKTKQKKKTKKKKDPNEPQKPISAYALFFRDTQAAIKGQNPNASFGEVSKIVASMWDGLEADAKTAYKKTAEASRKEYLKALAAYKASISSESGEQSDVKNVNKPSKGSVGVTTAASPPCSPIQKSPEGAMEEDNEEDDIFAEESSSKNISLADSPELTLGNDASNKTDEDLEPGGSRGIMSSDDDDVPVQGLRNASTESKNANESSVNKCPTSAQQQIASKQPMNGDISDSDEVRQICLRTGCENLAIDSPEWDREYCSSECVVVHCRDVFNSWVASKKMSPTY